MTLSSDCNEGSLSSTSIARRTRWRKRSRVPAPTSAERATIVRIEPDPLVSASDIAERAAITRQAVSLYVNSKRGEGFPPPFAWVSGSRPLWKWSEVAVWLHAAGKIDQSVLEAAQLLERLNVDGFFVGQHADVDASA